MFGELPPCLTVKMVAAHLGYTAETVYAWIRDGHLKAMRSPGGTIRVRRADLEEYERTRCQDQGTQHPSIASRPTGRDTLPSHGQKAVARDLYQLGRKIAQRRNSNSPGS